MRRTRARRHDQRRDIFRSIEMFHVDKAGHNSRVRYRIALKNRQEKLYGMIGGAGQRGVPPIIIGLPYNVL